MQKKSSSSVRVFYPKWNKEKIIKTIQKKLEDLKKKLPLLLVVLFGSYANRNYTIVSDVDLLVVYQGREKKQAYGIVKRALDIPRLEPHPYSKAEYDQMRETIGRMTQRGIILYQSASLKI